MPVSSLTAALPAARGAVHCFNLFNLPVNLHFYRLAVPGCDPQGCFPTALLVLVLLSLAIPALLILPVLPLALILLALPVLFLVVLTLLVLALVVLVLPALLTCRFWPCWSCCPARGPQRCSSR